MLGTVHAAHTSDVTAVITSRLNPYREAYGGFVEGFASPTDTFYLADGRPPVSREAKLVVAFGTEASLASYPRGTKLISCMAPGAPTLPSEGRAGPTVRIAMTPRAAHLIQKIKGLQPEIVRLGILWISDNQDEFIQELETSGLTKGIQVLREKMSEPDQLPDHLRALNQRVDAIWVPPDPRLLTAQSFTLLKEFSRSSRVPFYVSTEGFVERGATAAVAASFAEIGQSAARAARAILDGRMEGNIVYPEKIMVTISEQAADASGLKMSAALRKRVDKVLP